jgi:hypothetical protein
MDVLTRSEAEMWCRTHRLMLNDRHRPLRPDRAEGFDIPQDAGQRIALVSGHFKDRSFGTTSLVWFTEWGIWPSSERQHIFYRFRASYGETRLLVDAPAHLLGANEREDMLSFVTLGVLFLWDVYVVADDASAVLHYSHDECGWHSPRAAV